jgi:hypothetical protein
MLLEKLSIAWQKIAFSSLVSKGYFLESLRQVSNGLFMARFSIGFKLSPHRGELWLRSS